MHKVCAVRFAEPCKTHSCNFDNEVKEKKGEGGKKEKRDSTAPMEFVLIHRFFVSFRAAQSESRDVLSVKYDHVESRCHELSCVSLTRVIVALLAYERSWMERYLCVNPMIP